MKLLMHRINIQCKPRKVMGALFIAAALLFTGAFFHARLLSLTDGVWPLDPKHGLRRSGFLSSSYRGDWPDSLSTPKGFSISPSMANFIFSSLLRNAWHWGAPATSYMYADSESYYLVGLFPEEGTVACSFNAKLYGTRINGKTGEIFNRNSQQWEQRGYVNKTHAEVINSIAIGFCEEAVIERLGTPFSQDKGDYEYHVLHYWTIDGEIQIYLKEGKVSEFNTNAVMRV